MSTESQQLERSALEGKDREELQTIATALGGKPTTRATKAKLVGMILDLAGVTEAAGGAEGNGGSDTDEPSAEASDQASDKPSGKSSGKASGSNGSRDRSPRKTESRRTESSKSPSDDDDSEADEQHSDDRGDRQRNQQKGGQQKGGQQKGGQQKGGQQNGNQQKGNEAQPEAGNRRKRRRGRDRDRDRQPEVWEGDPIDVEGILDLRDEGYGFLRVKGYLPSTDDVYVSVKMIRQHGLRGGDTLKGAYRPATRNEKNPALLSLESVNGQDPEAAKKRPNFEDLTPLFPDERLKMETPSDPSNMTARIIDLISPIGKGQRGLIVSPPKAGKTTVMKQIARSIETNHPDVHLMVLLVDERPEEVTDMRRWVKGDVAASTFDRPSDEHTMVAELAIARAKRMVEEGHDVVIILDGITRLARAYNLAAPATGRIMSGGIDTGALYPPKKFFGAARNIEEGGSLTILATALIETGSKMDEVIFEEFKGTGNMELRLDRKMSERRIYPSIDVDASSTRHEELLYDRKHLQMIWKLRRVLSGLSAEGNTGAGLEMLIDRLSTFKTNDDFLTEVAKTPAQST